MSYAGVERDPGWVVWAEQETIERLRGQLSDRRAERELRRATGAEPGEAGRPEPSVGVGAAASLQAAPLDLQASGVLSQLPDHPDRSQVSALSEPPDRNDPAWHVWAEAQTILRLQQPHEHRADSLPLRAEPQPEPEPTPGLRIEVRLEGDRPTRTVRVHHENLRAVGI